jgi:Rrf2 family protein
MVYLARQPANKPTFQRDISDALNIPQHFLGKILQLLSRHGIVTSRKGRGGGFYLAKPAAQISPYEVITAIDGPHNLSSCLFGFPCCDDEQPCPVHSEWKEIRLAVEQLLQHTNFDSLGQEIGVKLESLKKRFPAE